MTKRAGGLDGGGRCSRLSGVLVVGADLHVHDLVAVGVLGVPLPRPDGVTADDSGGGRERGRGEGEFDYAVCAFEEEEDGEGGGEEGHREEMHRGQGKRGDMFLLGWSEWKRLKAEGYSWKFANIVRRMYS